MQLMAWNDYFVTGFEDVDKQHRRLVDMVNAAAPLLAEAHAKSFEEVRPLLESLAEYAVTHFEYEESLMAQSQIAAAHQGHHRAAHAAFTQEVGRMMRQAQEEGSLSGTELLRFLTSWLTFHILSEDMDMARQVHAVRAGVSPEEACRNSSSGDDGAHAALNSALIDLFGLLTARNASLREVNDKYRATQTELASMNLTLEARVLERTADLAQANEDLAEQHRAVSEALAKLEKTQMQLMQSEKMAAVGQLAAGVAHEINNPVGFVSSNVNTLSEYVTQLFALLDAHEGVQDQLPPEAQQALAAARQKADLGFLREDTPQLLRESQEGLARVKGIVADLKDYSHVDESLWQYADINRGVQSTLNVAWNEVKYKAEVVKELGDLPQVFCIASQINQVVMNLLVNAAQAIEGKGRIVLRTGVQGDRVWIEVEDNGRGMAPDVQQRIFEPFFTTKEVGKGTGLGLSISWEIIQRHQGSLSVRSTPGQGSTFRIELPVKGRSNT